MNGYINKASYHPLLLTLDEVIVDYNATKQGTPTPTPSTFNFILAGQSNAKCNSQMGVDGTIPLDLPVDGVIAGSSYYDTNLASQPYDLAMNIDPNIANGYGVEYRIAKTITATKNVNLMKYALGGSAVVGGVWSVTGSRTLGLIEAINNSGIEFEAFVWIQGESESANVTDANAYYAAAKATFNKIRRYTGQNFKLVLCKLAHKPSDTPALPYIATVNTALQDLANDMDNAIFVDVPEMTTATQMLDEQHYNGAGIDVIAQTVLTDLGY